MCIRLLLTLLLILPGWVLADYSANQLHTIRIQAFGVCSHLLAYYNPGQDANDSRHAERYQQHLKSLQMLLAAEPDSELSTAAASMREQIDGLEKLPPGRADLYPDWISPLLEAHARLEAEAAKRYTAGAAPTQSVAMLHKLTLDIERLLLIYQTRAFSLLTVYVLAVDDETIPQLDAQILQGFAEMRERWPEQSARVEKLQRNYDYIRPRVMPYAQGWVSGSAAFYLGKISRELMQFEVVRAD